MEHWLTKSSPNILYIISLACFSCLRDIIPYYFNKFHDLHFILLLRQSYSTLKWQNVKQSYFFGTLFGFLREVQSYILPRRKFVLSVKSVKFSNFFQFLKFFAKIFQKVHYKLKLSTSFHFSYVLYFWRKWTPLRKMVSNQSCLLFLGNIFQLEAFELSATV